mgnify:CR=1 FL=1
MVAHLNPASCPLLVVKVGSSLLVEGDGAVRREWLQTLVADIAVRHEAGQRIVIVSSGAIALVSSKTSGSTPIALSPPASEFRINSLLRIIISSFGPFWSILSPPPDLFTAPLAQIWSSQNVAHQGYIQLDIGRNSFV